MLLCVLYHSCYKQYCLCGSSSYKTERRLERSQDKSRMLAILVSLGLLRCLVEGNSQTFPYVSFRGQTLANHSYVDLSLVGYLTTDSVQCHTDLTTCCSGSQGIHRGDWYFPIRDRLQFDKFSRIVIKRELTYVARVLPHQLVYIVVTLQPLMFVTLSRIKRQCMWDCMQMDEV